MEKITCLKKKKNFRFFWWYLIINSKMKVWNRQFPTQHFGSSTGEECRANPNFCQAVFRYCGFIFSSFVLVWFRGVWICVRIIPTCFSSGCLLYFWYCNSSNGAQRTGGGGGAPWREVLKDFSSLRKRSAQKYCVALLAETTTSFPRKDWIFGKWET